MRVIIIGKGKLAKSLHTGLADAYNPTPWEKFDQKPRGETIVIHAGSGRQLPDAVEFCNNSSAILVELATGGDLGALDIRCPVILCPNTAIPLLKMMRILQQHGRTFAAHKIRILESHQKEKTTIPGTAIELARSLGAAPEDIESLRDEKSQLACGVPQEHLGMHAYHKVLIEDDGCAVEIQLKVLGHDAYVQGVAALIQAAQNHDLDNKVYHITEILEELR